MRAEVRQHTGFSNQRCCCYNVLAASEGKPTNINAPGVLSFATDLPASQTVAAGSALTMGVVVGRYGTLPTSGKRGTSTVSGQTSATFTKASAVSGDAGVYSCVVTDADGTVITSSDCTVTIN